MNKLMARIVAVVMAIAMLGTVSFAAAVVESINGTVPAAAADQDVITILAFGTNTANDTEYTAGADTIIAIVQEAKADVPAEIYVDNGKLAGKDYVAIVFSGSDGEKAYSYIDLRGTVNLTAVTVYSELTIGENVYENVAYAEFEETITSGTVTAYGINFTSTNPGAAIVPVGTDGVSISGEGAKVKFGAVIYGVTGVQGTITATPYVVYAQ